MYLQMEALLLLVWDMDLTIRYGKDNQGKVHLRITHWCCSAMEDSKKCLGTGLAIACHRPPSTLYSSTRFGDSSTTSPAARGLINHTSCCARGLLRPLSDHSSTPDFLSYMWNWTHIQLRDHYFLDLATRIILRLPASSGTTLVRCTCWCISVSSFHGFSF
jgi:hypothetical protein